MFSLNFISVPETSPPLLLYEDAHGIKWLHLNGSDDVKQKTSYTSPPDTTLLGLVFDHLNDTVCWIHHQVYLSQMRCALSNDLQSYWNQSNPHLYSFEG